MKSVNVPLAHPRHESYGAIPKSPTMMRRRYAGGPRYPISDKPRLSRVPSSGNANYNGQWKQNIGSSAGKAYNAFYSNVGNDGLQGGYDCDLEDDGVQVKGATADSPKQNARSSKLGTLPGVTMPTILNVLSILMFVRFGFVLGQMGFMGTLLLLGMSYGIDLLTTMSVSAIATNGIVKGGGAYYMISRSLGVEFGGAIGIILYIGQILNSALNVAGLIEPLLYNFGFNGGVMAEWLPTSANWQLLYATIVLAICTFISLIGAGAMSRCGGLFCLVLMIATLSVPISSLIVKPFSIPDLGTEYTGLSWSTFEKNMWPHYTVGAAGSQISTIETFNDIFGVFFPATAGILAGSAMSEDLKNPSKSIPTGTLQGIVITVICYFLVICSMSASIPRSLLYRDSQVIQTVGVSSTLIIMGETATALFSVIVGIVGASQLLQAVAKDDIFPGLYRIFALDDDTKNGKRCDSSSSTVCPNAESSGRYQQFSMDNTEERSRLNPTSGSAKDNNKIASGYPCHRVNRNAQYHHRHQGTRAAKRRCGKPWHAIAVSWLLCQVCLFADVNQLATMITMTFLMTFVSINVACGLLRIGSAPNFRPSFRFFNTYTAIAGTIASAAAMFIVDGVSACLIITFLAFLIVIIHYISPPKQWGDVSQSLIYHQVRKYLLKLRQDNVKYWRPQILLLVDNPRTTWKLINFCNHLKKGGLYVLGHVMVARRFQHRVGELNKERAAWEKLRDLSHIKAFVQVSIAPTFSWGVRNVFLGCGLGGMKPNITILAFYDLSQYNREQLHLPTGLKFENGTYQYSSQLSIERAKLPTDNCPLEPKLRLTEWVQTLEDLSLLNSNLAVAKGFPRLQIPTNQSPSLSNGSKETIDLYPIQMASKVTDSTGDRNILTTNFDTYTLILQLGAILRTVPAWHKTHKLRVIAFVEYEEDIPEERQRVKSLLEILRIEADVVVKCLDSGELLTYRYIAKGEPIEDNSIAKMVDEALVGDVWWKTVKQFRKEERNMKKENGLQNESENPTSNLKTSLTLSAESTISINPRAVRKIEKSNKERYTFSKMNNLGVSLSMVANKLPAADIHRMTEEATEDDWSYNHSMSDVDSMMSYASSVSAFPSPFMLPKSANAPSSEHIPQLSISSQKGTNSAAGITATKGSSNSSRKHVNGRYMRKPIFDTLKSTHSLRKERSSMMFTADTMPSSQILENAQGNEPSIIFVKDKKDRRRREKKEKDKETQPYKDLEYRNRGSLSSVNEMDCDDSDKNTTCEGGRTITDGDALNSSISVREIDSENTSINCADKQAGSQKQMKSEESSIRNVDTSTQSDETVIGPLNKRRNGPVNISVTEKQDDGLFPTGVTSPKLLNSNPALSSVSVRSSISSASSTSSSSSSSIATLSFNELPNRCQFLILNELMSRISQDSSLIFSTLPVPDIGLHENEEDCLDYSCNLELWLNGLPPVLLINAQTMTVTTNL